MYSYCRLNSRFAPCNTPATCTSPKRRTCYAHLIYPAQHRDPRLELAWWIMSRINVSPRGGPVSRVPPKNVPQLRFISMCQCAFLVCRCTAGNKAVNEWIVCLHTQSRRVLSKVKRGKEADKNLVASLPCRSGLKMKRACRMNAPPSTPIARGRSILGTLKMRRRSAHQREATTAWLLVA